MFFQAKSLISLNLTNFNTTKVLSMENLFFGCNSLVYINLKSFEETEKLTYNNFVSENIQNLIYCIDTEKSPKIYQYIKKKGAENDCENKCFKGEKKIIPELHKCVDDCTNEDIYKYENNNICYKYVFINQKTNQIENSEVTNGEDTQSSEDLVDSSQNTQSSVISSENSVVSSESSKESSEIKEVSSESTKESSGNSVEISENSKENSESSVVSSESSVVISKSSVEISESNEQSSESSGENSETSKEKNSEKISESNEQSSIESRENKGNFQSRDNNIEKFDVKNFFKESQQTSKEELSNKDEITKNLKEDLINGNLNSLLNDLVKGEQEDLIAEYKDITYQFTTTENQKNSSYNNISTIDLGECENKLKGIYGIEPNIPLIILKIDYKIEGLLIPVIGYEVYNPMNVSQQLNLSHCSGFNIKQSVPVTIEEDELEKYDPNSDYYNDDCYAYTTENGTDIILNDRKNEYVDNNLSLCENNCTFNGYDSITKKALCECLTKIEINLISEIISEENLLSNNFNTSENSKTNIGALKCVSLLFSKNGLIKNIGSYIIFFTLIILVISFFIFYKCGYHLIENNIQEILVLKTKNNNNIDIFKIESNEKKIKKKYRKSLKKKSLSNPGKKILKKKRRKSRNINKLNVNSASKLDFKSSHFNLNNEKNFEVSKKKNARNISNIIKYKETELNLLNYKEAILYDKRMFCEYYSCLNKIKISILFAFYPLDDYNIKIIKICLFFLSFDIHFSVNTFFFNDNTFHQIYLDGGKYNFLYFLPKILYSFVICHLIVNILKYFCLSESNFLEIKCYEKKEEIKEKANEVKRWLTIKYIIFFISSFVFLIVFWYYLSSFCALYQNTQIYLLINTFISFILSSLFPLLLNLIPSILRINALKKRNSECLYSASKFIQFL